MTVFAAISTGEVLADGMPWGWGLAVVLVQVVRYVISFVRSRCS